MNLNIIKPNINNYKNWNRINFIKKLNHKIYIMNKIMKNF